MGEVIKLDVGKLAAILGILVAVGGGAVTVASYVSGVETRVTVAEQRIERLERELKAARATDEKLRDSLVSSRIKTAELTQAVTTLARRANALLERR